jgi:hypothetical protein
MSHGPTYIPSKGVCIYCKAAGSTLTDEHIVPLSLGGFHVISKASCLACGDITTKFERQVSRELWGDARVAFDMPSRRKKQRSHSIAMHDPTSPSGGVSILAAEYPAGFVFYKMGIPGILQGLSEDIDTSHSWQMVVIDDDKRREEFIANRGRMPQIKFRHVPQDFGRLIAKIGYGHILTQLDIDDFQELCVPYILGSKTNLSHIVGGVVSEPPPLPEIGYSLSTSCHVLPSRMLLLAEVRLLALTHAPTYKVVVGEVLGPERIGLVLHKLNSLG